MSTDKCQVEINFHFLEVDPYTVYEQFIIKTGVFRGADILEASVSVNNLRKYLTSALLVEIDNLIEDEKSYLFGLSGRRVRKFVISNDFVGKIGEFVNIAELGLSADFDESNSYYKVCKFGTDLPVHLAERPTIGEVLGAIEPMDAEYFRKASFIVSKFDKYAFTAAGTACKYFAQELSNIVRTSRKITNGDVYLVPAIERVRKYLKSQGVYKDDPFAEPAWRKSTEIEIAEIVVKALLSVPMMEVGVGIEFEKKVANELSLLGWSVTLTKATGDFGVDIVAGKNELSVAIQVKSGITKTGVSAVQQAFAGAKHYGVDYAAVISNAEFTPAAFELAAKTSVYLFRANQIAEFDSILLQ